MPTVSYSATYIHKIRPNYELDRFPDPVELRPADTTDRKTLAAAFRKCGLLSKGDRLADFRVEPNGRIVAFPSRGIWHSIIVTPDMVACQDDLIRDRLARAQTVSADPEPVMPRPVVSLLGRDGNAFAVLGACKRASRGVYGSDTWDLISNEAMAGDYDHLIATVSKYFEIQ